MPTEPSTTAAAAPGSEAARIAQSWVEVWQEIERLLAPIVGAGGVAALYRRSLHLAGADHPWLEFGTHRIDTGIDLPALQTAMAQRSGADAVAGGRALLQSFRDLLTNLIGGGLSEQLLGAVWAERSSHFAPKDTMP